LGAGFIAGGVKAHIMQKTILNSHSGASFQKKISL